MASPLLTVDHLTFGFHDRQLYSDLSFNLARGSMTSLIGANGVGKTTLIRLLMGQLTPQSGHITHAPDMRLGYVPQFRNIDPEYPLSLRSFIQLNQRGHWFPWHTQAEKQQLDAVIRKTALTARQGQLLGKASGGEKQKAYLAQALLTEPNFLILDEATASLDVNTKTELMTLVRQLSQQFGLTVLFVTHDLELAREYTDQYLLLTATGHELRSTQLMEPANMPAELRPAEEVR
ncbi:metal ABC transporter ATP-binding protein [Lacticaseibacillus daqingensis]|uniref:metal ABC transporter ATP-binding protein n=1 Tax=Lacticaseibacillus daqingensis TaxID=2486014 RepID=UPI000F78F654|nr:ATP-binding cassette domain-containing protein [Lacticaseibacillus daqingensis]